VIAEARLAHALAIGCLGKSAAAADEVADVEESTDLLSSASKQLLVRNRASGTPANEAELTKLLVPLTTTTNHRDHRDSD
jgi:hypothetical protein